MTGHTPWEVLKLRRRGYIVLTAEEAAEIHESLEHAWGADPYLALLTPPEHPSVPADHLADVQEEMADKALEREEVRPMPPAEAERRAREQSSAMRLGPSLTDVGPPAPGEGDDLPNPEMTVEC